MDVSSGSLSKLFKNPLQSEDEVKGMNAFLDELDPRIPVQSDALATLELKAQEQDPQVFDSSRHPVEMDRFQGGYIKGDEPPRAQGAALPTTEVPRCMTTFRNCISAKEIN